MKIVNPTEEEIAEYRERTGLPAPKTKPIRSDDSVLRNATVKNVKVETDDSDDATKSVLMAAGLWGIQPEEPKPALAETTPDTKPKSAESVSLSVAPGGTSIKRLPSGLPVIKRAGADAGSSDKGGKIPAGLPMVKRGTAGGASEVAKAKDATPNPAAAPLMQLSESTRLINTEEGGNKTRLEVQRNNRWTPVVTYEIYDDVSLRHEFKLDGTKKTIRIDLPPSAVKELAQNDLSSNWKNYSERFLSGRAVSE
jgi:hypothetical protein